MSAPNTISIEKLLSLIGTPKCPTLIDVRAQDECDADPRGSTMQKSRTVCYAVIAMAAGLIATTAAETADTFRKLTASEIKSKVSGMEIEDVGEHWAEQYMRNGSLKVFALDKLTTGKWRVQNGELCVEIGPLDSGCGEVWISGNQIEFRGEGPRQGLQGILQKQQPRK